VKPGGPVKRKRTTGLTEDSDEESMYSDDEESGLPTQATKRAKLVAGPPEPLDLTAADDTVTGPVAANPTAHPGAHPITTHVAVTHPAPIHPGAVDPTAGAVTTVPAPPVVVATPVAPHLIPSAGRGPNAVSDAVFNSTHEVDYEPLNEAADAVALNPSNKKLSEALGEQGAVAYVQAHTGYSDIELHHATPQDPHQLLATAGQRWSHAVGFNGAHVADISYWDGAQFHVIEAKGGGSQLGRRDQTSFHKDTTGDAVMAVAQTLGLTVGAINNLSTVLFHPDGTAKAFNAGEALPSAVKAYLPTKLYQGTMAYLTDIAHAMSRSDVGDGREVVGQAILDNIGNVHYQPVGTQAPPGGVNVHTM
jgi:hypothetical protein